MYLFGEDNEEEEYTYSLASDEHSRKVGNNEQFFHEEDNVDYPANSQKHHKRNYNLNPVPVWEPSEFKTDT